MNILAIIKVAGILWRVSRPVAEHIVREAEYAKIKAEFARIYRDKLLKRLREACGTTAGAEADGRDSQRGTGTVSK